MWWVVLLLYSCVLVLILPNIKSTFFFFKATFLRKWGYCDCASCIHNTFWLHPVTLKLAHTRCLDAWWESMWAGWGIEIGISSDGKAGMQVLVIIRESRWRCYEYSDLSKILNTHLLLTTFGVSDSEEAKFHLFHSWNNFCVFEVEMCERGGSFAKLLLDSVMYFLSQSLSLSLKKPPKKPKRLLPLWDVAMKNVLV